jgi:hypothetical protein
MSRYLIRRIGRHRGCTKSRAQASTISRVLLRNSQTGDEETHDIRHVF